MRLSESTMAIGKIDLCTAAEWTHAAVVRTSFLQSSIRSECKRMGSTGGGTSKRNPPHLLTHGDKSMAIRVGHRRCLSIPGWSRFLLSSQWKKGEVGNGPQRTNCIRNEQCLHIT